MAARSLRELLRDLAAADPENERLVAEWLADTYEERADLVVRARLVLKGQPHTSYVDSAHHLARVLLQLLG